MAMSFAGVSRPASGVEHYISHVWEMRALELGMTADLHGNQCAVGTLIAARLYERLLSLIPEKEKALHHAQAFSYEDHSALLRSFLGGGAEVMIALEKKEKKYDPERHAKRLETILSSWDQIITIIKEEIPTVEELTALYDEIGLPKTPEDVGMETSITPTCFALTGDIRDKYVLSRLLWDLGVIEEFSQTILEDMNQ
jgi:glycerol-1-phosphate dehydrogenase [NAD(P)+]